MTLQELLATVPEENRAAIGDFVASAVEAEKQVGITTHQKQNKELIAKDKKLASLGWDKATESFEEFEVKLNKTKETATQGELTIAQLSDRLGNVETELSSEKTLRLNAESKVTDGVLRSQLNKAIGTKLFGGDFLVDNIILNKELVVDGDTITTKDGDTFDSFVTSTLEANKDNVRSEQKLGSDTLTTNEKQTG